MIPSLLLALLAQGQPSIVATIENPSVRVSAVQSKGWQVDLQAKRRDGRVVTVATTDGSVPWKDVQVSGRSLILYSDDLVGQISLPATGNVASVTMTSLANSPAGAPSLGFVFSPSGRPSLATETVFPVPSGRLATTEHLSSPLALVSGGGVALALMPNVKHLEANSAIPPVLALGVTKVPQEASLLAYGLMPFSRDANSTLQLEASKIETAGHSWKFDLLVTFEENAKREALDYLWKRDGEQRVIKPLPQTVPFRYYTRPAYDIPADQWWTGEIDGMKVRAPKSKSPTSAADLARFAWGLRWWGDYLQQGAWTNNANEVMNLVATATQGRTSFDTSNGTWVGGVAGEVGAAIWANRYITVFETATESEYVDFVSATATRVLNRPSTIEAHVFLRELAASNPSAEVMLPDVNIADAKTLMDRALLANEFARLAPRALGGRLLEDVFLRQAIWQPPTVAGTEVFGAIRDEHQLTIDQALWAPVLLEAAVRVGDAALAKRAVAALRAPLALFNHQTYGASGIWLPRSLGLHRAAAWFDAGTFGPEAPIAEGSGRILASLAWVTHKFGSVYTSEEGWTIGIDAIEVDENGGFCSAFSHNPLAFQSVFPFLHVDDSKNARTELTDPVPATALRDVRLALDEGGPYVVALTGYVVVGNQAPTGLFDFGGEKVAAAVFARGIGARPPIGWSGGPVTFNGSTSGRHLAFATQYLNIGPPPVTEAWPRGWRRLLGLRDIAWRRSERLSTADDGKGGKSDVLQGQIESQSFLNPGLALRMRVRASNSNVRVEVIDVSMGVPIAAVSSPPNEQVTVDLRELRGATLRLRLVDESTSGSIEVWDIETLGA